MIKRGEGKELGLSGNPNDYHYTKGTFLLEEDRTNQRATLAASRTLGFTQHEIDTLYSIIAAILHLVSNLIFSAYYWPNMF